MEGCAAGRWHVEVDLGGSGKIQAYRHLQAADVLAVDETAAEAGATSFAALVLPGGVANGDLRQRPAQDFLGRFLATSRPVAVICHSGWI